MVLVWVEVVGDGFRASVHGPPHFTATGATRAEAVEAVRAQLVECVRSGQLVVVTIPDGTGPS